MDAFIPGVLSLYGALLLILILAPDKRWAMAIFGLGLALRFFGVGLRTNVGTDIEAYTAVLTQCDLSSINALELFWNIGCLPSSLTADIVGFPFLWIGLLDTVLFWVIARKGGLRVAALHDLVYLPSTSMGAIRQALAMKLIILAVLIYLENRNNPTWRAQRWLLAAPLVHLAGVVPALALKFKWSGMLTRIVIVALPVAVAIYLIDDAMLTKIQFYLEFEGFRSVDAIYASWIKRIFIVTGVLLLMRPAPFYWLLYAVGLLFASTEFIIPEIAVRIGAYFEQFEVFLIGAAMRPRLRRLGSIWYGLIGLAYVARFVSNVMTLS